MTFAVSLESCVGGLPCERSQLVLSSNPPAQLPATPALLPTGLTLMYISGTYVPSELPTERIIYRSYLRRHRCCLPPCYYQHRCHFSSPLYLIIVAVASSQIIIKAASASPLILLMSLFLVRDLREDSDRHPSGRRDRPSTPCKHAI